MFSRTAARIFTFCVKGSPFAVWNQRGRFQLLCQPTDLMLTEVLQGFTGGREFNKAKNMLTALTVIELGGQETAIQAARNFRALRKRGVTVRKTIDTVIATRCIESGYDLLHSDRDFDPFVNDLGLRVVVR